MIRREGRQAQIRYIPHSRYVTITRNVTVSTEALALVYYGLGGIETSLLVDSFVPGRSRYVRWMYEASRIQAPMQPPLPAIWTLAGMASK